MEIDKKCQRLKKYKKPISLYYLSDVGGRYRLHPLDLPKLAKLTQTKFVLGVPRMETL